ncbi:uncharacterized protein LOC134821897 isoform X1 [Bolinopsis microptera]|uniref:uncharacterized protein LOC134821897 isoform X1 n=1 Tax=Bolinopsis microptera TaxID=2820187 RepID=UPI0030796E9B
MRTYQYHVLPFLLLPVVYGLKCCNTTTSSDGHGYSITSTPQLNVSDQISVCLWVRPLQDAVYDLVSYVDPERVPVLYISTRQVIFSNNTAADITIFDESTSTHICVTWHIDKGVTTFVNGEQHGEVSDISNDTVLDLDFTGVWSAGLQSEGSRYPSNGGLVGSLCGFTLWSEALPSSYITSLYNNQMEGSTEGYTIDGESSTGLVTSPPPSYSWTDFTHHNYTSVNETFCYVAPVRAERHVTYWTTPVRVTEERDERSNNGNHGNNGTENAAQLSGGDSPEKGHGIRLGSLDPVASKFVILFLVIIGVIIGFAGLFMCSEREIAIKRAQKRLKDEENFSIDNASTHSVT